MTFSRGSKALCKGVSLTHVSGRTYHARCTTKTLPTGRNTITAVYPGDAGYAPSTGRLVQTVARAPTALTERVAPGSHRKYTLTAKLTASGRPLGGQPVSFSTGHTHLCSSRTSILGVASCVLTEPRIRLAEQVNEILRASFPGSANYRPSSATVPLPRFPWVYHGADPAPRKVPTP
jgi:hypothetical protein